MWLGKGNKDNSENNINDKSNDDNNNNQHNEKGGEEKRWQQNMHDFLHFYITSKMA